MIFPDFTLSKPLARQRPTPRINCNIGAIEIKTHSNPGQQDIARGNASVDSAVYQAAEYAIRLSTHFSLLEQNSEIIATYVVYGDFYTRVYLVNEVVNTDPWQYIFEEFSPAALAQGRAPMLFRLCELAVRHWAYNG